MINIDLLANYASDEGGALDVYWSYNIRIVNINFTNNAAWSYGGALNIYYSENLIIANTSFTNNRVTSDDYAGGAIYLY